MRIWGGLLAVGLAACGNFIADHPTAADAGTTDAGPSETLPDSGPATEPDAGGNDADADIDEPPPTSRYASAVVADGPKGYWRMAGTGGVIANAIAGGPALDPDGGTSAASPTPTAGPLSGESDNVAVELDGQIAFRAADPARYELTTPPLTVECWARQVTVADAPLVGKFTVGIGIINGYALTLNDVPAFRFGNGSGETSAKSSSTLGTVWHHLVGVATQATILLYVDGKQVAKENNAISATMATAPPFGVGFGGQQGQSTFKPFTGAIDEVAIYDRALSAERIQAHFDAAKP